MSDGDAVRGLGLGNKNFPKKRVKDHNGCWIKMNMIDFSSLLVHRKIISGARIEMTPLWSFKPDERYPAGSIKNGLELYI